ncbi:hypothetical protein BD779DRAFT_1615592 [Infundibulicybe gibba]|nr:hypothetical protein BD779DRAFT_1615592 [Infundibulicybe gibba]
MREGTREESDSSEIEDEDSYDAPWDSERYIEAFPRPAGIPINPHRAKTKFELLQEARTEAGQDEWAPFASKDEWELAMWLMKNVRQKSADEFLKLPITRDRTNLSFHSNYMFLKKVNALPTGPDWECKIVKMTGDQQGEDGKMMEEEMELWFCNPIDCMKELIGNPTFKYHISYTPEHVFTSNNGDNQVLDEMWMADWWWDTQNKLPDGATIAPIILASDKTQLSQFRGNKKAWPLDCYTDATCSLAGYWLFHYCMAQILTPLVKAGQDGIETVCADGFICLLYIILAAYIADYPEQCLVACCMENRCPHCLVDPSLRGSLLESLERDPPSILKLLDAHHHGVEPSEFDQHGIRPVYQPFWHDLPHCNIFRCLMPDLLHQLHKGVFKDHLVKWCTDLVGSTEIDVRFKAMSGHPGLRHFKKRDIIRLWTGTEHKEMEKVFLGILAGAPGTNSRILTIARALLNFIYYAQLQTHTTKTLNALQSCLETFHENKDVFVELGTHNHFNFPKLHSLLHYLASILSLGANDGYNSEVPEHLHIDLAKDAYCASNKRDYHEQMVLWLQRYKLDDSSPAVAPATTPIGTTTSAVPTATAATTITIATTTAATTITIATAITATTTVPTTTIAEVPAMETASLLTHHHS